MVKSTDIKDIIFLKYLIPLLLLSFISCDQDKSDFYPALDKLNEAAEVSYLSLKVEPGEEAKEYFYRWEKLGETIISKKDLQILLENLSKGYEEGKNSDYSVACFEPRHVLKSDKVEILICFYCEKLQINMNKRVSYHEIRMTKDLFNKIANKYKLKLEQP